MISDITAIDLAGSGEHVRLLETPDVCPLCHRSVHPKIQLAAKLEEHRTVQAVFRCTHQKCQELFIASYRAADRIEGGRKAYELVGVAPIRALLRPFPDTVAQVSPVFVAIHSQALEAESWRLDQLVGIGLRKGLEFLIKDFAVQEHPDKAEQIRKTMLGPCIAQYITDPSVKECAKRAAWLGNDETHYTRKWEERDVQDLKLLVRLTVNWIDSALLTKKYIAEMPGGA